MLAVKGIKVDTSVIGMRILRGEPIIIDQDINFREQINLLEQIKYFIQRRWKIQKEFKLRFQQNLKQLTTPQNNNNVSQQQFYKTESELTRYIFNNNQLPTDIEYDEIINEAITNSNFDINDKQIAIICFDKAIELDPNCAIGYDNKGSLLSDMKKYQQAIENYEQALLYCKQGQNKFKKLIIELGNQQ